MFPSTRWTYAAWWPRRFRAPWELSLLCIRLIRLRPHLAPPALKVPGLFWRVSPRRALLIRRSPEAAVEEAVIPAAERVEVHPGAEPAAAVARVGRPVAARVVLAARVGRPAAARVVPA